jgi:beta-galactosidase
MEMNIEYDIIPAEAERLNKYDCVIVPALYSAREDYLKALDEYVADGGNLIASYKSAFSDEHLKVYSDTQPHILNKALGIHYDQFTYPKNVTVSYNGVTSQASEWMEMVSCDTATPLAPYGHHTWNRYSAITKNQYGSGHSLYLATLFGSDTLQAVLADFFAECHIEEPQKLPFEATYPVAVKQGINEQGHHVVYFLNYSKDTQTVTNTAGLATELLSDVVVNSGDTIVLAPWGVAILEFKS